MDETVLDWKYPAYVIDTRKTGDMQGKEFDKLRNKFNKVAGELNPFRCIRIRVIVQCAPA